MAWKAPASGTPALREGVNTYNGYVTHGGVAESQGARSGAKLAAAVAV